MRNVIYLFMTILWDEEKTRKLKASRKISFEEIAELLSQKKYRAVLEHPSRKGQMIFIVPLKGYIHAVPFVIDREDNIILKTAFPSRKFQKLYGEQSHENETY